MNNNTKIRLHLSKALLESIMKDVILEGKVSHAQKLTSKMKKLGENKAMKKAKAKMEETIDVTPGKTYKYRDENITFLKSGKDGNGKEFYEFENEAGKKIFFFPTTDLDMLKPINQ